MGTMGWERKEGPEGEGRGGWGWGWDGDGDGRGGERKAARIPSYHVVMDCKLGQHLAG